MSRRTAPMDTIETALRADPERDDVEIARSLGVLERRVMRARWRLGLGGCACAASFTDPEPDILAQYRLSQEDGPPEPQKPSWKTGFKVSGWVGDCLKSHVIRAPHRHAAENRFRRAHPDAVHIETRSL